MSNLLTATCKAFKMPPTAKSVLMALADYADDNGLCWPSISGLCEYTCFGKSAVIEAIKLLEGVGVVVADRTDRYRTSYVIRPERFIQPELVRQVDKSGRKTSPHDGGLVREPENEVREPDTNHHKPSRTTNRATTKRRASAPSCDVDRPADVTAVTWSDWLTLRKAKKAPVTATVLANAQSEAAKAGMPLENFLQVWCARGSQGLQADWLKPNERAGPGTVVPIRPSASADFRGKSYASTAIDDLPPDLREAARAAISEG